MEITDRVDKLTATGDIFFPDRIPTPEEVNDAQGNRKKTSVLRLDIDSAGITACDPAGGMGAFDYQTLGIVAWSQAAGGGWERLGADQLAVNPFGPNHDFGFPESYVYLGNYPENNEGGFKNELNGVAHDAHHWYFSKNGGSRLLKIPVGLPLGEDWYNEDPELGLYTLLIEETGLDELGYNHFGDIDVKDGFIYVPVEPPDDSGIPPAIAVFYSSPEGGDFEWVSYFVLTEQVKAGWCAVRQEDEELMLYSSNSIASEQDPIRRYRLRVVFTPGSGPGWVDLEPAGVLQLQSGSGEWNQLPEYDDGWALKVMQGGVFSERGHLYLVNGSDGYRETFYREKGGIWVFDVHGDIATLVDHSNQENQPGTFEFEFHTYDGGTSAEEPEGIDIWELDSGVAPGISGQIHVIMIDNFGDVDDDDLYFKHYTTSSGDLCIL